jgi:hypothetical protein
VSKRRRARKTCWRFAYREVAAVLTYVRNAWGNAAPPISSGQFGKARQAVIERSD